MKKIYNSPSSEPISFHGEQSIMVALSQTQVDTNSENFEQRSNDLDEGYAGVKW